MTTMLHLFSRAVFLRLVTLAATSALLIGGTSPSTSAERNAKRIPVIYDTDIGDDIDDTWALGFVLRCPELDVKLVVGDRGKAQYRAKLLAKFLEHAGRTDVAVGVGLDIPPQEGQPAGRVDKGLRSQVLSGQGP